MASEREKLIAAARDHAISLARMALQRRVKAEAVEDYFRRGFVVFEEQGQAFDTYSAQEWSAREQVNAPHLFEAQDTAGPGTPTAPKPQTQAIDYAQIKDPAARLTAFRAAEAQGQVQQGQRP